MLSTEVLRYLLLFLMLFCRNISYFFNTEYTFHKLLLAGSVNFTDSHYKTGVVAPFTFHKNDKPLDSVIAIAKAEVLGAAVSDEHWAGAVAADAAGAALRTGALLDRVVSAHIALLGALWLLRTVSPVPCAAEGDPGSAGAGIPITSGFRRNGYGEFIAA